MSFSRWIVGGCFCRIRFAFLGALACFFFELALGEEFKGLPPTRSYPLVDIAPADPEARLAFDSFGRLAIVQDSFLSVLNDSSWISLADNNPNQLPIMLNTIHGEDGRYYYGGRGSWGLVESTESGRLRGVSFDVPESEDWVSTAYFREFVSTENGIYFVSWNGVVFYRFSDAKSFLFELPGVVSAFRLGDRVYLSAYGNVLRYFDPESLELKEVDGALRESSYIQIAVGLGDELVLASDTDGRLLVSDGSGFDPWAAQTELGLWGDVSALCRLVDGGVAVAIVGKGVFMFDRDGELVRSLAIPDYHYVVDLASNERGILWAMTKDAVVKVSYSSPLGELGRKLGLNLNWPIVQRWRDGLYVVSNGQLHEAGVSAVSGLSHFSPVQSQLFEEALALASNGERMLVGTAQEVFELKEDRSFVRLLEMNSLQHIAAIDGGIFLMIGRKHIIALKWIDGEWVELADRIPGIEYAAIAHSTSKSAWLEMGGSGVARIWLENGELKKRLYKTPMRMNPSWENVGVIGDIVVCCTAPGVRRFFDESLERWVEAPELNEILENCPYWVVRVTRSSDGSIWASHPEGISRITKEGEGYRYDSVNYNPASERNPRIRILEGDDVWIAGGRSLNHVERIVDLPPRTELRPRLVSILNNRNNTELLPFEELESGNPLSLSYSQNSLTLCVFAGGYDWRRTPTYEFRLGDDEDWVSLDSGSRLNLSSLREGDYSVQIRFSDEHIFENGVSSFIFEIKPPWHRTNLAYFLYAVGLIAFLIGLVRWSNIMMRKRNQNLDRIVRERTLQLESAIEERNEEARNAATLAERNRLAGEIHDSLQQGLSGAMFQLDTTLKLPVVEDDVRSRLDVVRSMVSFTRQEVQHLVWDMESPLLEGGDLSGALKRLAGYIDTQVGTIKVMVEGEPLELPYHISHNLLRIAQEATTNAVKHAKAEQIEISLCYSDGAVSMAVVDDGVGFDTTKHLADRSSHFGLRGIRSRCRKMVGELVVRSEAGSGTEIKVSVKVNTEKESEETNV